MNSIKHNGVRNGIIMALVAIGLATVLYLINKSMFLNPTLRTILSIVVPIYFLRKAAIDQRDQQEGTISFAEALQVSFVCLIIGAIGFTLFQVILFLSDPSLLEIQREIAIETAKSIGGMFGAPEDALSEIDNISAEDLKPRIGTTIVALAQQFIFGFILAAIISGIVKRS